MDYTHILMNKNTPVLFFNPDEYTLKVINEKMLPYTLRDNLIDTDRLTTIPEGVKNYDKLRHFFADRTLSLSRENAKQILESIQNKQNLTEEEHYRLSLKCRGISVNDCFWVKEFNEELTFDDVDIRKRSLSDVIFQVSMKGTPISIEHSMLAADLSTKGMFRKTWIHKSDGLYLLKSDTRPGFINTKAELKVSDYLKNSLVNHVEYTRIEREGMLCCECKCATNEHNSFVEAEYIKAYLSRKNIDFIQYIKEHFSTDFANMVVCDYLFANPDEHIDNWGFRINTDSNEIIGLFPLFDNNQALIALELGHEKEFDSLIYDPTGKTTLESAIEWFPYANLGKLNLTPELEKRLNTLIDMVQEHILNEEIDTDEDVDGPDLGENN